MSHPVPADRFPKLAGEPRQLLFLALCSLALVVAAFAAPPTTQGASSPDVPFPNLVGNESQASDECVVTLSENPVPGRQVTVTVHRGSDPASDVRVWVDDRAVGVTNDTGQVATRVPYVRELEVTVGLPGGGSCEFDTATALAPPDRTAAAGAGFGSGEPLASGTNGFPTSGSQTAAQRTDAENVTGDYAVTSGMIVGVEGEANPGERVRVVATIAGDPVPGATVSVDGDAVGRTDEAGEYALSIPDDGTERLTVRVQRGEIRGQTRIDVRLLRASVTGENALPVPGQSGTVEAAIGSDAVEGADVSLDGEPVGTTDDRGQASIVLPADPTATVTVTTGDRTTRAWVLTAFAPTILTALGATLLTIGVPLSTYWVGGRRAVAALLAVGANLLAAAAGYALAGRDGALVAAGSTTLLLVLVLVLRRPQLADRAGESTGRLLEASVERVVAVALSVTRAVEAFLDQAATNVREALSALRGLDPAALATGIGAWILALPGRLLAALGSVRAVPRRLFEWARSRSDADDQSPADESETTSAPSAPGPAIRELWRRFARRVAPDRWPQRTPGEVSRLAVDAGYSRARVAELTAVFRDVEYGGQSLSDDDYRRARTAFDALESDVEERSDEREPRSEPTDEPLRYPDDGSGGEGSTDGTGDDTDDGPVGDGTADGTVDGGAGNGEVR